jgi:hypothetical protein
MMIYYLFGLLLILLFVVIYFLAHVFLRLRFRIFLSACDN